MSPNSSEAVEIDERGTRCPQPIIALGQATGKNLAVPTRIVLLADDPATTFDVPAWCRLMGATLVSVTELTDGSGLRFEIET